MAVNPLSTTLRDQQTSAANQTQQQPRQNVQKPQADHRRTQDPGELARSSRTNETAATQRASETNRNQSPARSDTDSTRKQQTPVPYGPLNVKA
jgi:hypothetical protein